MKNLSLLFVLAVILCGSACETDFQLEGEWEDIPVVYAFLSEKDTAYYVRVEKAFLQPGGDATQLAQIPDSIYYGVDDVVVALERGTNGQKYTLQRVDGRTEGYPREEGNFANEPNYLYKLPRSVTRLRGGDQFRIIVDRGGQTAPAIAESTIIDSIEVAGLPFSGQLGWGEYARDGKIEWRYYGPGARVFDLRVKFRYRETDPANPTIRIDKEVTWVLNKSVERVTDQVSTQVYRFPSEAFYQFIGSTLEPLNTGTRKFDAVVIEVTAAGPEIEDYLRIAGANIGITSSQAIPLYTNVTGGVGVVSSRYKSVSAELSLDGRSRDSLFNGSYTKLLNFVP